MTLIPCCTHTLSRLPRCFCAESLAGPVSAAVDVPLVFVQQEESRVNTRLPLSLRPRLGLTTFLLHPCLLLVLAEFPYSSIVYVPCEGCCHCCVIPAASLTHKEELRRRGGVECVEAGDNQKTASTALHCSSQQMDETSALSQFGA